MSSILKDQNSVGTLPATHQLLSPAMLTVPHRWDITVAESEAWAGKLSVWVVDSTSQSKEQLLSFLSLDLHAGWKRNWDVKPCQWLVWSLFLWILKYWGERVGGTVVFFLQPTCNLLAINQGHPWERIMGKWAKTKRYKIGSSLWHENQKAEGISNYGKLLSP